MSDNRLKTAKLNISTTLLRQLMATLCGIVIPIVMIEAFGSAVYGATTSIAQFLSYIALLEGGIGRVARGALYRPLAEGDTLQVSRVHRAIRSFFNKVGIAFMVYTLLLAVFYHDIADVTAFDRTFTFGLVLAISLFTFANYMGGIANLTLMNADQKQYVSNLTITVTNLLNTVCIVLLVALRANVLIVKLVSSLVFVVRPLVYWLYVKKHYVLPRVEKDTSALSQKWTGMGQHIAYFLHTNTDVVLLTLFADLKIVAIYSVYRLVATSIWNIAGSFSGGMEAAFGEMIAKKEQTTLEHSYGHYKALLTMVSVILFGSAAALIVPFVKLYTAGVTDANYIRPLFGLMLVVAEAVNCIVLPCSSLPVSGNCLKQTKWGAYCEAAINILLSLALIRWNPLLGVAIGTLAATLFKGIYYICYTAKHFVKRSPWKLLGKFFATVLLIVLIGAAGMLLFERIHMPNFLIWALWGIAVVAVVSLIALAFCRVLYPMQFSQVLRKLTGKLRRHK